MNKTLFSSAISLILAMSLWAVGSRLAEVPADSSPMAYGFLIADESGRDVGLYSFPVADCSAPVQVAPSADVSAGAMADGVYYAMTYASGGAGLQATSWNSVDLATGEFTKIADATDGMPMYVDMTYDYTRGKLLGLYHYDGASSAVVEIDPATGMPTPYVDLPGCWMVAMACDYDGYIYLTGRYNTTKYYLFRLDEARKLHEVASVTNVGDQLQSMEFDHKTGKLYWATGTRYSAYYFEVNPANGDCTYLSDLGKNGEITGLYIPFKLADDGAPAAVRDLAVADNSHDGNIEITFMAPSLTVDGQPLTEITSTQILCDGEAVSAAAVTAPVPGGSALFTATVPTGLHKFTVSVGNAVGAGVPVNSVTFVGVDRPAAPAAVRVAAAGSEATISWDAVTAGAQGGYIDPAAVTYTVVRQPDGLTVASGIAATSCTDVVPAMNAYRYSVTATAAGLTGEAGLSDFKAIGEGFTPPYSCDFTADADLVLWDTVDVEGDGYTWSYTSNYGNPAMIVKSTYSYACDEWLISPALRLEAGKEYKIVYSDGAMNETYPPVYTIAMGTAADPAALTTEVRTVTVDTRYPAQRIVYLPVVETTGVYHIGIHAKWGAGNPVLYFGRFRVEENRASHLTLSVTDTAGAPVQGASLKFGERQESYISDAEGRIEVIEIDPGTYHTTISCFGYITDERDLTFGDVENKQLTVELQSLPTASVSGTVTTAAGRPLENATVYVHGYDEYSAVTDADGRYSINGIYATGSYSVDVHALNYAPASRSFTPGAGQAITADFTLQEKLIAPSAVEVEATRAEAQVHWTAPADREETFRYDDGQTGMINSYEMQPDICDYTVTGTVYDTPAVFTGMSFRADASGELGIVVFDLNEDGTPTNTILYEQRVAGNSWNWVDVEFTHPVIAPRGAFIALRGNSRLYFDGNTDGTRDEAWPVRSDRMWFSYDYRTKPIYWIAEVDGRPLFGYNFLIRAKGRTLGAPRAKEAAAGAPDARYSVWRLADGKQDSPDEWTLLTDAAIDATAYTDAGWQGVAKGLYRYAVKAVYAGDEVSYPAFSAAVPRLLTTRATLAFTTDVPGVSAAEAAVLLVEKDGTHSYTATVGADGSAVIEDMWEGTYTLTATKAGFNPVQTEITVAGEQDFEGSFGFHESIAAPSNFFVEETGTDTERLLRWDVVQYIYEDFEGFADGAADAPGEQGWSYIDGDAAGLWGSWDTAVEGPAAFVAYDADAASTSYLRAHSGKMVMAAQSTNTVDNDDYIISPELSFGREVVLSFWAYSYWLRNDEIRVGYSTAGKELADFTWIGSPLTIAREEAWENFTVNIPADARYVAINVRNCHRVSLIDDIFIGDATDIPGVTALRAPAREPGRAESYEVFLDGVKVGTTAAKEYLLTGLSDGTHTAGVRAVFASGASEMLTAQFEVKSTGIGNIGSDADGALAVSVSRRTVTVTGHADGTPVSLIAVDGRTVDASDAHPAAVLTAPAPGVYVVTAGRAAVKVLIR